MAENSVQKQCSHYTLANLVTSLFWMWLAVKAIGTHQALKKYVTELVSESTESTGSWGGHMGSHCSERGNTKLEEVLIISWPACICLLVQSPVQQGSGKLCYIPIVNAFSFPNTICYTDLLKRRIKTVIHCYRVNRIPLRALALSCHGTQCAVKTKRCLHLWDKGAMKTECHPLVSYAL